MKVKYRFVERGIGNRNGQRENYDIKKNDFETFQLFISFLEKNENKMIKQVGQLEIKLKIRKQSNRNI